MINPEFAAGGVVVFLIVFGVLLPALNAHPKFKKMVSLRWCCMVVVLAVVLGATMDFSGLPDECRKIILLGGLVLVGLFIALRTLEKLFAKGCIGKKPFKIKVKKGEIEGSIDVGVDGGKDEISIDRS